MPPPYAFAFFPYLRTSGPVTYRGIVFKNSADNAGIPDEACADFALLKSLFFLRDNYLLSRTTYAMVTLSGKGSDDKCFEELLEFQTILAYLYSGPRAQFNDIFLSSEHATLYWFVPKPASRYLICEEWEVESLPGSDYPPPDDREEVPGYEAYLNGRLATWVAQGSRLYPPGPRIVMNRSQDLCHDLYDAVAGRRHTALLEHFGRPGRKSAPRDRQILTAIRWYNRANADQGDEQLAIVNLAIAFEALLNLPGEDRVTQRFTEAITLLLGRLPRLESWAEQFYNARSSIVHKGTADRLRFFAADDHRKAGTEDEYKPLAAYGRQIFQLCVATIVTGADLADSARLTSQLATNAERFQRVCHTLSQAGAPGDLIAATAEDVADINEYRYQSEAGLTYKQVIASAQLMTRQYLLTKPQEPGGLMPALNDLSVATDEFHQLDAIRKISEELKPDGGPVQSPPRMAVHSLIECVWHYTFMRYYDLQRERAERGFQASGRSQ